MTVVSGRLPNARRPVQMRARLVDELGRPITKASVAGATLATVVRWTTGPDGAWSVDLTPNGGVLPPSSRWEVAERGNRRERAYLDVPAGPVPVEADAILDRTTTAVVIDPAAAAERARIAALEAVAESVPAREAAVAYLAGIVVALDHRAQEQAAQITYLAALAKDQGIRLARVESVPVVAAGLRALPPRPPG